MTQSRALLFVFFSLLSFTGIAQVSYGGFPRGFTEKKTTVPFITMPKVDKASIEKEIQNARFKKKNLVGKRIETKLNIESDGRWTAAVGGKLWQLGITSEGAKGIGLFFSKYKLTEGCELYIYTPEKDLFLGAFTHKNNKRSNNLPVQSVSGDTLIVELWMPESSELPELEIGGVLHDYIDDFVKKRGSEDCDININCSEGDLWQVQKRAVVKFSYSEGGLSYSCTGTLVNNTAHNETPYLLSANHCIDNQEEAETAVFYFGYESTGCSETVGDASQTLSGADFRATGPDEKLDFSLIELSRTPPSAYNPYYAGWNRTSKPPASTVTIHHPNGAVKKISKDNDAAVLSGQSPSGWPDDDRSHWIVDWDEGSTSGGSSGAPLFDQNQLLVGDLSGGDASCQNPNGKDYFTCFDQCWDKYAGAENSLVDWLDPAGTNQTVLVGYPNLLQDYDLVLDEFVYPKGTVLPNEPVVPQVVVKNWCRNQVEDFRVDLFLDDVFVSSVTPNILLNPMESVLLEFAELPPNSQGELQAEIVYSLDENLENNLVTSTFGVKQGKKVELRFPGIDSGNQIGWVLTNQVGEVLYERDLFSYGGTTKKYMIESYPMVLDEGCYTIQLTGASVVEGQAAQLYDTDNNEVIRESVYNDQLQTFSLWENGGFDFCIMPDEKELQMEKTVTYESIDLKFNAGKIVKISLIDYAGRILKIWNETTAIHSIPMQQYQSGVYFVRCESDGTVINEKIVYLKP